MSEIVIVGMKYNGGYQMSYDDIITLEYEPDNRYDKYAIKAIVDGKMIGHVSKSTYSVLQGKDLKTIRVFQRKCGYSAIYCDFSYIKE